MEPELFVQELERHTRDGRVTLEIVADAVEKTMSGGENLREEDFETFAFAIAAIMKLITDETNPGVLRPDWKERLLGSVYH